MYASNGSKSEYISMLLSEKYEDVLREILGILNEKRSAAVCLTGDDSFLCEQVICLALEEYEKKPFREIAKSNDYLEAERQGQIKVSNIRDLISFSGFSSEYLKHRYIVISDIHRVNNVSENSLLKLFEEPPNDTVIFTWTNSYHSLLPTVRSRLFRLEIKKKNLNSGSGGCEEWEYISGGDLRFLFSSDCLPAEEREFITRTLRNNTLEDNIADFCRLCCETLPDWTESYTLDVYTWRELMSFFIAENLLAGYLEGNGNMLSDYSPEILKNIKGINTSDFFSCFFRALIRNTTSMIYDMVNFEFGSKWEKSGYTNLNARYFKCGKGLRIVELNNFIRWCEKIAGMEKMTVNPELSLRVFDIMLKRVFE